MASYEPPTSELLQEFEKAGRRHYVFFHAEWDESSGVVTRRWTIEADLTSATDDVIDALKDNGWTLVFEARNKNRTHLLAEKILSDFCGSAHITVSDERRELRIEMAAPNSRSEPPPWEKCLGLEPEDRDNLETLGSDPMASYAPPTGELLRYEWRAQSGHLLGVGNVEKSWDIVADQKPALAHISDAMRVSGWTLTEVNHYEQTIQVKAHKLISDFCALAYIDVFTEGSLKLELTPAVALSECETSS